MPGFLAEALSWEHNFGIRTAVKAAQKWGRPPMSVLRGEELPWSKEDSLLATALIVLEQETCSGCGVPSWIGHSTSERYLDFAMESATCFSCATLENDQKGGSKDGKVKKEPKPGERRYVVPFMHGDRKIPTRYTLYEREAVRRRKSREEG